MVNGQFTKAREFSKLAGKAKLTIDYSLFNFHK